jgi:hypothetical protein
VARTFQNGKSKIRSKSKSKSGATTRTRRRRPCPLSPDGGEGWGEGEALDLALVNSAGHDGPLLYRGPSAAAGGRRKARRVAGRDAGQFGVRAGDGMDAGVEATQERLPDALSTNPVARTRT